MRALAPILVIGILLLLPLKSEAAPDESTLIKKLAETKELLQKTAAKKERSKVFISLREELKKEEAALNQEATSKNRLLRYSLTALNQYFSEIQPDQLDPGECLREKAAIEYLAHPPGAAAGEELGEARAAKEFLSLLCR